MTRILINYRDRPLTGDFFRDNRLRERWNAIPANEIRLLSFLPRFPARFRDFSNGLSLVHPVTALTAEFLERFNSVLLRGFVITLFSFMVSLRAVFVKFLLADFSDTRHRVESFSITDTFLTRANHFCKQIVPRDKY